MLLVPNLANTKLCKNPVKRLEFWHAGYSSNSTQRELSNLCVPVLYPKVVLALEGLRKLDGPLKHESEY